jgi:hypothetical protein
MANKFLTGLAALVLGALPHVVSAQDVPKPQDKPAVEQPKPAPRSQNYLFKILEADAAIPGAHSEIDLLAGKQVGDAEGSSAYGRGRVAAGGFFASGRYLSLDSDWEQREFEDFSGGGTTDTFTGIDTVESKRTGFSARAGYGPFEVLANSEKYTSENAFSDQNLTTDPTFFFLLDNGEAGRTKISTNSFAARYLAEKLQAGLVYFGQKSETKSRRHENVTLNDTTDPMFPVNFVSTREDLTELLRERTGGVLTLAYVFDGLLPAHPLVLGVDAGYESRKSESRTRHEVIENGSQTEFSETNDKDSASAYLFRVRGRYGPASLAIGATKDLEDKSTVVLDADYLLYVADNVAFNPRAGIRGDTGKAYFGGSVVFVPRDLMGRVQEFNDFTVDRSIAPSGSGLHDAYEHVHGLANAGSGVGMMFWKGLDDESRTMAYATLNVSDVVLLSLAADIQKRVANGQLQGEVRIGGPLKLWTQVEAANYRSETTEFADIPKRLDIDARVGLGGFIKF